MGNQASRATLPDEFYDVTSTKLLLTPEPQYLHARLILSAVSAGFEKSNMQMALPIPGRDIPDGVTGSYVGLDQLQFELADPLAEEAIMVVTDFSEGSKNPGHTIRFNRPKFTDSTYTLQSRMVATGAAISTSPIAVQSEQTALVVSRIAGPYDNANSHVAPLSISVFDAQRMLHSAASIHELHFTRDFHKTIDSIGVALFDNVQSSNVIYPDGMTADNDSAIAGDFKMDLATLLLAEKRLDDLGIPRFSNGRRMAVLTTQQKYQLTRDPEYQRQAQFHKDFNPLYKGTYVGTVSNTDIHMSTTLTVTNNSNTVPIHYGQMFGPNMVGVGPAQAPKVVANTQDNYGEDTLAIWLWYCAFGTLDTKFGVSIRTS